MMISDQEEIQLIEEYLERKIVSQLPMEARVLSLSSLIIGSPLQNTGFLGEDYVGEASFLLPQEIGFSQEGDLVKADEQLGAFGSQQAPLFSVTMGIYGVGHSSQK